MRETFHKSERLCSKARIAALYSSGHSFHVPPFRIRWQKLEDNDGPGVQVVFVVPKSAFRKAHDRNLLKRRMREAFRRNKPLLYEQGRLNGPGIALSISYYGKEIASFAEIREKIILILHRLLVDLEKSAG